MAAPVLSFAGYLSAGARIAATLRSQHARDAVALARALGGSQVTVVMGNQACDADSIVTSLTYGYALAASCPTMAPRGAGASPWAPGERAVLSMLPIPRPDLKLRRETVYLLTECAGLPATALDNVLCAGDLDLDALAEAGALRVVLTDHNVLSPAYRHLESSVVEIVDHHKDGGECAAVTGDRRVIAFDDAKGSGIASCCTLVADWFKNEAPELLPQVAAALLGVILIDSSNLDPKAGKTTPADSAAVEQLVQLTGLERTPLFTALVEAKFDPKAWAALSVTECIGIDYKQFAIPAPAALTGGASTEPSTGAGGAGAGAAAVEFPLTLGCGAVLVRLEDLIKRKDFCSSVEAWCASRGIHVFMLLSFTLKPKPRRQILVYRVPGSEAAFSRTVDIVAAARDRLGAERVSLGDTGDSVTLFEQGVVSASRKQVLPAVFDGFAVPAAGDTCAPANL